MIWLVLPASAQEEDFDFTMSFDFKVTVTAYNGAGGAVSIPGTIGGFPVVAIGERVFAGKTNVTSVTVPAGVTNVGNYAFATNANLTGVYFQGHAPGTGTAVFASSSPTVYRLASATGWGATFGGRLVVIYETPTLVVTPPGWRVGPAAYTVGFGVSNAAGGIMVYEANEDESWLAVAGGGRGTNNGTITVSYNANTGTTSRTGTVTVTAAGANGSPTRVIIIQEKASTTPRLSVTPAGWWVVSASGTVPFTVTNTGAGTMAYVASEAESWLSIAGGGSGTNGGALTVSFTAHAGTAARTGTVIVTAAGAEGSPASLTIIQSASGVLLEIAPSETNLTGAATVGLPVYVAAAGAWTASVNQAWISIDSGGSGSGNGLITYRVAANDGDYSRTAHIVVSSGGYARTCAVSQAAARAMLEISPSRRTHSGAGASGKSIGVMANVPWTATDNRSWIKITSGGSGSGNGLVTYRVAANPGIARSGTITISGGGLSRTCKVIQSVRVDAYEPDNTRSAAKKIANGRTQSRSIHAAGDVDWAKFRVGGAGALNVRLETSGASGDTQMWLIRSDGRRVAYDNNGGTGAFSRIVVASLPPGTYAIKIREYGNDGTIPFYTLQARWSAAPIVADAYESDDSRTAAKSIANGETQDRSIHAAGNADWVKFRVARAGARNLRLETSGLSGNTQMWLYNRAGARWLYDDDSGTGRFSRITAAALAPGTYTLKIQDNGNNGKIAAYRLKARWLSP